METESSRLEKSIGKANYAKMVNLRPGPSLNTTEQEAELTARKIVIEQVYVFNKMSSPARLYNLKFEKYFVTESFHIVFTVLRSMKIYQEFIIAFLKIVVHL